MRATFPRLPELEARHGSLIRGLLATRAGSGGGPVPTPFVSLRGGLEELVQALVAQLPAPTLRNRAPR